LTKIDKAKNVVVFVLLVFSISYSLFVVNYSALEVAVAQAPPQSQAARLPPLESLPPDQNPFTPIGVRGVGEIDTMNIDGDRINIYISSPTGMGNVRLTISPVDAYGGTYIWKTFNLDTRIAYSGDEGPDQYGYYTVRVPALLYYGVAPFDLYRVRVEVLGTDKMVCEVGSFLYSDPARIEITLDNAHFAARTCEYFRI